MSDFESLYNECQANAFAAAKEMFYDNKVGDISEKDFGGKTVISAAVKDRREHRTKIIFDEQGGLYDYSCDCEEFDMANGPCKHIIATALSYEEKNPQSRDESRRFISDSCVQGLISSYAKLRIGRIYREDPPVNLTPVLGLIGDLLYLRFTIGKKRAYKLKNIEEFCVNMSNGAFHRYGSALAFEHFADNFSDESKKLVAFIVRTVRDKRNSTHEEIKDKLFVSPSDLDDFIDVCENGLIEIEEGNAGEGVRQIVKQPDALKVRLDIRAVEGGCIVKTNLGTFRTLNGRRYDYVLTSSRIYRVTDEFVSSALKLLVTLNSRGEVFICERDIGRFYNNVLKEARFTDVNCDFDLTKYDVPPLKASLFLDLEGDVVQGKLECFYGDVETDIFSDPMYGDRDIDAEENLKECLARYFPYFPHLALDDNDSIYLLMTDGLRSIGRHCEVFMAAAMQKISVRKPPGIKVGVKLSANLIDLDLSADGYTYDELVRIIGAAKSSKYIRLGNDFIDLTDPGLKALSNVLGLSDGPLPLYYAPHIIEELGEYYELGDECKRKLDFKRTEVALPGELKEVLRAYQITGVKWLTALKENGFGGILADDMGLGKSLQIIALIMAHGLKTIIVCPTTLILNWKNEFEKFAPNIKVLCVMGGRDERVAVIDNADKANVVITSYELIRRDIDSYTMDFDLAVLDEAQFIKNPETKNSKAVKKLKSKYRFALTGTPIENSLAELWSIFDFLMPGYLFSYGKFKERFEVEIVNGNKDAEAELRRLVMPFILRRLKAEVLSELPPKVETNIVAPLTGEQADYYNAHLALIRRSIKNQTGINKITVLTMLTKLRRICCDPSLEDSAYKGNSAKLEACLQLVDSAIKGGHKTLIFSQFTSMLDIIREKLLHAGVTNYMLTGDTPKAERMKFVNRFNRDDTQVFLISLRAGGTGLNLTGADVVIHYDPWWNLSVMNQATDRAYRIGQQRSVQVYSLLLDGTLEQKIVELQKRKAGLSGLLEGDSAELSELLKLIE